MTRVRRKRLSLSLRLQPYEGDPMAEVVDYLNSLPKDEVNRKVADILVAALLPYARYHSGKYTQEQLRFACWEAQDSLNKHGSNMRLALGVEQPQFVLQNQVMPQSGVMVNPNPPTHHNSATNQPDTEADAPDSKRPTTLIPGQVSSLDLNTIFGVD
ncbi:hypothetical protein NIES37_73700 (plasmid) [Tolypothrix tenuis PCC 7101]|uniref:Uncharacterized protein n=1 Tax=Tolypothrix tenuis PCC 7101 TaxID=231146 RepID=A0A1Z4NCB2_9CYAN|nr:hypothetical protein [Aulosira sp. FACHB-113]BAZ03357.1 hypothetical protein NIES37_73700 [Tolypothrix tenuis PCC 7101]BAZ78754.1 hypothetical protein NIES50_73870 [Aulosira laxa NIES-50]